MESFPQERETSHCSHQSSYGPCSERSEHHAIYPKELCALDVHRFGDFGLNISTSESLPDKNYFAKGIIASIVRCSVYSHEEVLGLFIDSLELTIGTIVALRGELHRRCTYLEIFQYARPEEEEVRARSYPGKNCTNLSRVVLDTVFIRLRPRLS